MPEHTSATSRRPNVGVAVVGVVIGVVYLVVGIVQHQVWSGVVGLLIMLAYAGLMYGLRRRSEPAQLLSGNLTDERQAQVMLRSSAATGSVLIAVVVAGMLVCMVTRASLLPVFSGLSAVGGAVFIASILWYSRRT